MEKNKNEYYVVSVEDTIKYGIICASIIGRVRWWCKYNQDNKVKDRFHLGEWWSGFMSAREFSEQTGINQRTIETNLSNLIKKGILIKNQFNKKGFDKTGWYRVNPIPLDSIHVYVNNVDGIRSESTSIYSNNVDDVPLESITIPVNHSVNQNVNQSANPPVNRSSKKVNDFDYKKEYGFD